MLQYLRYGCIATIILVSCLSAGCGSGYTDENVEEKVVTDEMIQEQMGGGDGETIPGEEAILETR